MSVFGAMADHVNVPPSYAVMNLAQCMCGRNTNRCKLHFYIPLL
jgi:hypothetical protein